MEVEAALREISNAKRGYSNPPEKEIGALRSKLEYTDVNDILTNGLHEFLDDVQIGLNDLSTKIHDSYFKIQPNFAQQIQTQE